MISEADIAVLMPVYNPGSELHETLASLRGQTVPFHLFLVDDGSTTRPAYSAALHGITHTLIELPRNLGIAGALNAGLREILKGRFRYVARMDNGDIAAARRLEVQANYCSEHPEASIVGSFIDMVFEHTGARFRKTFPCSHAILSRNLRYNTVIAHPAMMLRADLFRAIGLYSERHDAAEDYELCRRAEKSHFKFATIPEALLVKVENPDSISWKKRGIQLRSRLRTQLEYMSARDVHSLLGVARTILQMVIPAAYTEFFKIRLNAARGYART